MRWQETKRKLIEAAQFVKQHKLLDATLGLGVSNIPVVGSFAIQYWNNLDLGEDEKAALIADFFERLSQQDEKHFELLCDRLEEQKEEYVTGKQSLDTLLDDVAVLRRGMERIEETGTAAYENTEDLLSLAKVNQRMIAQIAEFLGIRSVSEAIEAKGRLSEEDLRITAEIEKTHKAIRERIRIDPTYSYRLGLLAVFQRRYLDAQGYFEEAVATDPEYGDAYTGLGFIYQMSANDLLRKRDFASAEQFLNRAETYVKRALTLDIRDVKALVQLGYVFKELGQRYVLMQKAEKATEPLQKAKRYFELVLVDDAQNASAYNGLGNVCFLQGDLDGAIAQHEKAICIASDYLFAHHDLAGVYHKKGNEDAYSRREFYAKAIREYKQVLQLSQSQPSLPPDYLDQIRSRIDKLQNYLNQN